MHDLCGLRADLQHGLRCLTVAEGPRQPGVMKGDWLRQLLFASRNAGKRCPIEWKLGGAYTPCLIGEILPPPPAAILQGSFFNPLDMGCERANS